MGDQAQKINATSSRGEQEPETEQMPEEKGHFQAIDLQWLKSVFPDKEEGKITEWMNKLLMEEICTTGDLLQLSATAEWNQVMLPLVVKTRLKEACRASLAGSPTSQCSTGTPSSTGEESPTRPHGESAATVSQPLRGTALQQAFSPPQRVPAAGQDQHGARAAAAAIAAPEAAALPTSPQLTVPRDDLRPLRGLAERTPGAENPQVYLVKTSEVFKDEKSKLKVVHIGSAHPDAAAKPWKVLVTLGATGAGKSTWLNFFVNFIAGVRWEDAYRLRLIVEPETQVDQAQSQTSWVTAYHIHWQPGFQVDFSVTIVDTPGFGDTRGIQRDREITASLSTFFGKGASGSGLTHLDAVCFVVPAAMARLTHSQRYVFDSILALFGKDITGNITVVATFADASEPPVKSAILKAKVPYNRLLRFNNSALFVPNHPGAVSAADDEDNIDFQRQYWEMGMRSFEKFAVVLAGLVSKSLEQTKQVLNEREAIECRVQGISRQVTQGLGQLEIIKQEMQVLKKHEADLLANRDFTYEVKEQRTVAEKLPPCTYVTNCLTCNFTCHYPCGIPNNEEKRGCSAMGSNGYCTVCPKKCFWDKHRNTQERFLIEEVTVTKTADDLKSRYDEAGSKCTNAKQLLERQCQDYVKTQAKVLADTEAIRKGLQKLSTMALREDPLTHLDYIDSLIQSERSGATPGWKVRVEQLLEVRKQAEHLKTITSKDYNPLEHLERYVTSAAPEEASSSMWKTLMSTCRASLGL